MTKELQDRAWVSLPPEFRKEVREMYKTALNEPIFNAYEDTKLLEHLFGKHNLTFTEPDEKSASLKKSPIPKHHKSEWIAKSYLA